MTIDFAEIGYYWLPRINDGDVYAGGTYAPVPVGGAYYYTDLKKILPSGHGTGNYYYSLALPAWFPQRSLISRVALSYGNSAATSPVEYSVYVDVKGVGYKTGHPAGAEVGSDFTRDIVLLHGFVTDAPLVYSSEDKSLPFPVVFDRVAGDHLVVDIGNSVALDWLSLTLGILAPSGFQPILPGTTY